MQLMLVAISKVQWKPSNRQESRAKLVMFINEVLMLVGGSLTTLLAMFVMVRPKNNNPFVSG